MDKSAVAERLGTLDNLVLVCIAFVAIGVVGEFVLHFLYSRATRQFESLSEEEHRVQQTEISRLNNDTEHLRADNLKLLRALTPRHLNQNEIGENKRILDSLRQANFTGLHVFIQSIDDQEAKRLAAEMLGLFAKRG